MNLHVLCAIFKMSESDEELFYATQLPQVEKNPSVSDMEPPCRKLSVVDYFFVVTFSWDLMTGSPFEMNVLEVVKAFPDEWISGPLSKSNRLLRLKVSALGINDYSLFCKVQKGSI